jgi:hypothetical protein
MNVFSLLKNVTAVDVVSFVLFLMALYLYFFMDDEAGALYMNTVALFFYGISFIVDAINGNRPIVINVQTTGADTD